MGSTLISKEKQNNLLFDLQISKILVIAHKNLGDAQMQSVSFALGFFKQETKT